MAAYEILIADDHPLFRSALQQALTLGLGPQVRLVEAASIAELEACLSGKADWDLVLLDLNMPGAYGFSGLVLLRGQYPQVPVVMVSAQEEAAVVARAEAGAVKVDIRPTDVAGVLEDVRRSLLLNPEAAAVKIDVVAAGDHLVARADSQRLTQVVGNLANNAVKYGASGGLVGALGGSELMRMEENGFTLFGTAWGTPGIAITRPYNGEPATAGAPRNACSWRSVRPTRAPSRCTARPASKPGAANPWPCGWVRASSKSNTCGAR